MSKLATKIPDITLNNGVRIPQVGFGVFKIPPAETTAATLMALEAGYRHIDTAEMYHNEKEVGEAIRRSGIPRDEIFVTSKLNNGSHAYADALSAFDRSLDDLGLDHLDLFLIHWPLPKVADYVETWRAMEEIQRSDRVRAVGVSNFQTHHLERLLEQTDLVPAVNQIEVHPYLTQKTVRSFNEEHGIATEAWSPLAKAKVVDDPTVREIADRVEHTVAQVVLRWHIQHGHIIFPKSVTPERVRENIGIFDFELTEEDMGAITALNRDMRTGPDPDTHNASS